MRHIGVLKIFGQISIWQPYNSHITMRMKIFNANGEAKTLVIPWETILVLHSSNVFQKEKENDQYRTCIDYLLSLLGRRVGLLFVRSSILGNEVL